MKCFHCLVTVHAQPGRHNIGQYKGGLWQAETLACPACHLPMVYLVQGAGSSLENRFLVYPRASGRPPVPTEVDDKSVVEDYREACEVLPISPKGSAALSRRCLQHILRTKAGVNQGNLADEIQQVIDGKLLPSHLVQGIDAVRNVGNFAAHPIKSTSSGEILPVEAGEAEWNLDVIEGLLDFYFVQPATLAGKRATLNKKLQDAGKPPLK